MQKTSWWAQCLLLAVLLTVGGSAAASDVHALVAQGNDYWAQGDLDRALEIYRQAVEQDERSVDARMKLGGLHVARQEYRAGAQAFQSAIGLDPENANAFIGLAIAYLHLGQSGAAHAALEESLRLDPSRSEQVAPLMQRLEAGMAHPARGPGVGDSTR
jgi:tetratricopeptide (TPR) repeat protein